MHIQIFDFAKQNGYVYGTFLCNSMSLAHLSSRDMSSDLKAEIINRGRLAQTNTHTHKRTRSSQHSDVQLILSQERDRETRWSLMEMSRGKREI